MIEWISEQCLSTGSVYSILVKMHVLLLTLTRFDVTQMTNRSHRLISLNLNVKLEQSEISYS